MDVGEALYSFLHQLGEGVLIFGAVALIIMFFFLIKNVAGDIWKQKNKSSGEQGNIGDDENG